MKKIALILFLSLYSAFASASPSVGLAEEASTTTSRDVGLAVLVLAEDKDSIARDNPLYQRIVGKLQKQIKKSDFFVFNAILPAEKQPDWSLGLVAVNQSLSTLDNPYIDTLIIVNASVAADEHHTDARAKIRLQLQLFDVTTQTVFSELTEEAFVTLNSDCSEACTLGSIGNSMVQLGQSMTAQVIESIRTEYNLPNYQLANR